MQIVTKFDLHQQVWRIVSTGAPAGNASGEVMLIPTVICFHVYPFSATVVGFVVQGNKRIFYRLSDQYVAKEHELFGSKDDAQIECDRLNNINMGD